MKLLAICFFTLILTGCGTLTELKPNEAILGFNVQNTLLVVEEEFEDDGSVLPKGTYYPSSAFTDGTINYVFPSPIKVKVLWLVRTCKGGLSVDSKTPYEKYRIFYYGCGNPVTIIKIPKTVKFKVVELP